MLNLNPNISIIMLNVNYLNIPSEKVEITQFGFKDANAQLYTVQTLKEKR